MLISEIINYQNYKEKKPILLGISPRTNEGFLIDFEHNHESFCKKVISKDIIKWAIHIKIFRTKLLPINQILSDLLSLVPLIGNI